MITKRERERERERERVMRSLSILFVIALCVHASVCGASPRFPWAGRRGMVGFVGGSKSHSQGEGLDLSKKTRYV